MRLMRADPVTTGCWSGCLLHLARGMGYLALLLSFVASVLEFIRSLVIFFYTDGLMYLSGKAYKPTDPGVVRLLIGKLRPLIGTHDDWTFVDLGCGQGAMLLDMRAATTPTGTPLFRRVVGVELDADTHRQAVRKVGNDPSIEVVCEDMFAYVRAVCAQKPLLSGRAIFYMYEPLWAANMPAEKRDALYSELLACVGAHAGSLVVYITGVQIHERHIAQAMLERAGLKLQHEERVRQSGAANKLSATYNTMEIWKV